MTIGTISDNVTVFDMSKNNSQEQCQRHVTFLTVDQSDQVTDQQKDKDIKRQNFEK